MKQLQVTDSELDELILIMQMSNYDAGNEIKQSHDVDEVQALRDHIKTLRKWEKRFKELRFKGQPRRGGSEG